MNYYVFILSNATNTAIYTGVTNDVRSAIEREKQIKGWNRARKNKYIERMNPTWQDLYNTILP